MLMFACYFLPLWSYLSSIDAKIILMAKQSHSSDNLLRNRKLLDTVHVKSSLDCARFCSAMDKCSGYKYHVTRMTCQRMRMRYGPISGSEEYNQNLRFTSFQKIEVKVKCGKAPVVPGARKKTNGYFPGDVTTYTCNPDYTRCHNITTSVCTSRGKWLHRIGLCGRFRWYKPKTAERHYLPCGPRDRCSVSVVGIPIKKARRVVLVIYGGGGKILLNLNFGINHKTVHISNRWGFPIRIPRMPLVEGQEFHLVVTLDNGHYKIMVDDVSLYNSTDRRPGVSVKCLTVTGDVSVSLVEFTV